VDLGEELGEDGGAVAMVDGNVWVRLKAGAGGLGEVGGELDGVEGREFIKEGVDRVAAKGAGFDENLHAVEAGDFAEDGLLALVREGLGAQVAAQGAAFRGGPAAEEGLDVGRMGVFAEIGQFAPEITHASQILIRSGGVDKP